MFSDGKMQTRAESSTETPQPQLFPLDEFFKCLVLPFPALLSHAWLNNSVSFLATRVDGKPTFPHLMFYPYPRPDDYDTLLFLTPNK